MIQLVLAFLLIATAARADVTLGALLSLTGPGAGLGIPERNTIDLLPKVIAGQPVRWSFWTTPATPQVPCGPSIR